MTKQEIEILKQMRKQHQRQIFVLALLDIHADKGEAIRMSDLMILGAVTDSNGKITPSAEELNKERKWLQDYHQAEREVDQLLEEFTEDQIFRAATAYYENPEFVKQLEENNSALEVMRVLASTKELTRKRVDMRKAPRDQITRSAIYKGKENDELPIGRKASATYRVIPADEYGKMDLFDMAVLNATYSNILAGNMDMTASQIYNTMAGGVGKRLDRSPTMAEEIDRAMLKFNQTRINGSVTLSSAERFELNTAILQWDSVSRYYKGKLIDRVYHILQRPKLLENAERLKQITAIPLKAIETPLKATRNTIILQETLLYRIDEAQGIGLGKLREKNSELRGKALEAQEPFTPVQELEWEAKIPWKELEKAKGQEETPEAEKKWRAQDLQQNTMKALEAYRNSGLISSFEKYKGGVKIKVRITEKK